MPLATQKQNPVEVFMRSWSIYQDIIKHNYMYHREITDAVQKQLESFRHTQPIRILDLGCGDASMVLPLLAPEVVQDYIGCDLSQAALDLAHDKLKAAKISHQCLCDDMLQVAAQQPDASINLVFSSYALHHLNASQKKQIVVDVARILKPNGYFVLIDIFREPEEDLPAYMHHYMSDIKARWLKLAPESQDLVVNHATAYDFPEHPAFYKNHCKKQKLGAGKLLAKHTWHEAWIFKKPSA